MNHESLLTLGNKLRASGGWESLVMGIWEGTYYTVHWVLYTSNESWKFEKINKFKIKKKGNTHILPLSVQEWIR